MLSSGNFLNWVIIALNTTLPLIQTILIHELVEKIDFVIKKANTYHCLKMAKLQFLDILNYISPGFRYRSFLLAFGCTAEKFFFPYCLIRDLKALEHPCVPPYEVFFSEITNSNISQSEYEFVKKVWKKSGRLSKIRSFITM